MDPAGIFATSFARDAALVRTRPQQIALALFLAFLLLLPVLFGPRLLAISTLILISSVIVLGLQITTGYAGQINLGQAAFMGVGAYACYKLSTLFPGINIIVWIIASGLVSCAVGVVFGLPSLRIKGFYLAIATLAAQFFLQWCFIRIPWLTNGNTSGAIEVPQHTLFGIHVTGANALVDPWLVVVRRRGYGRSLLNSRSFPGRTVHRPVRRRSRPMLRGAPAEKQKSGCLQAPADVATPDVGVTLITFPNAPPRCEHRRGREGREPT